MNLGNRAAMIRRFYHRRVAEQCARSSRAEAVQEAARTIEDGFRVLLVDRAVGLITTYYEAGETDEAFEALRCRASALAAAAARLEQDREVLHDRILGAVETAVEPMYDELTAMRLIAAFRSGFG
jgi:hypothetical protein